MAPNLYELITEWLTSKNYKFTTDGHQSTINIDGPLECPTFTVNIILTNDSNFEVKVLKTALLDLDEEQNKVTCSPASKMDDNIWSMSIGFETLDCRAPDFFDRLFAILSSPASNSTSVNMLSWWKENDTK